MFDLSYMMIEFFNFFLEPFFKNWFYSIPLELLLEALNLMWEILIG